MYELLNATDDLLDGVNFTVPATGNHVASFNVPEDEMDVLIEFSGTILGGAAAALVELGFSLDGATAPQKLSAVDVAAGAHVPVSLRRSYRLSRGVHKVALFALAGAADLTLKGTLYPSRLTVRPFSSETMVAANQNVKSQGLY